MGEENKEEKPEEQIYIYKGRTKYSHFALDNGKAAKHNHTIALDESDLKRKFIKDLIANGKKKDPNLDRLIKIKKKEDNDTN